jgi:two-component system, sensor histidine kinase PdtaS
MTLGKVGFGDGAFESCLAQAVSACPALSRSLRATAGSLFALVSGVGAWGIFAACHAGLGWPLSALAAVAYLFAIGALQWMLVDRFSVAYRRAAEERDEASRLSAERETMLAETQHRIANNLAAISAMLSIQGRRLDDDLARRAIEGAAGRVRVVGELNRMFDRLTLNRAPIDDAFVRDLVANCIAAAGVDDRVRYETSIDPIDLPRRNILLVALILNECVNNALEHGFPSGDSGTITIRLEASYDGRGKHRLTIADDGVGPPAGFDLTEAQSAGLAFVNSFALQISGSFRLESGGRGARSVLIF